MSHDYKALPNALDLFIVWKSAARTICLLYDGITMRPNNQKGEYTSKRCPHDYKWPGNKVDILVTILDR